MTTAEVKDALRRRYPSTVAFGQRRIPGPWTCIEELYSDLTAFSAWTNPKTPGVATSPKHPIVGHEIKVSRADYRRELLRPAKRATAVSACTQFYFVAPEGLLSEDEMVWEEPEWAREPESFRRTPCPLAPGIGSPTFGDDPGPCYRGKRETLSGETKQIGSLRYRERVDVKCEACNGKGYVEKSRIEREAPTLWVPADVGLIVVKSNGCHVAKKAPVTPHAGRLRRVALGTLVRWVSVRPDPGHVAIRSDSPPAL